MTRRPPGRLRIVGGQWRSRLIEFDPASDIRPTPDRVRQTLFDWLAPTIVGARCLDLFAGSGALGFEALSRGAAQVTFIERSAAQAAAIRAAAAKLVAIDLARVVPTDALAWLRDTNARYDLVFLDPPYGSDLLGRALAALPACLGAGARIYLEWPRDKRPQLPADWTWLRDKRAGQVSYGLATCCEFRNHS